MCTALFCWKFSSYDSNADDDVDDLRTHLRQAHSEAQSVFNSNRGKRLQYALDLALLPGELGEKARLLEHFLLCAFQECTPRNWVCLHSLPNCHEQQPHSDFCRQDIMEAVAQDPRAYPFECT